MIKGQLFFYTDRHTRGKYLQSGLEDWRRDWSFLTHKICFFSQVGSKKHFWVTLHFSLPCHKFFLALLSRGNETRLLFKTTHLTTGVSCILPFSILPLVNCKSNIFYHSHPLKNLKDQAVIQTLNLTNFQNGQTKLHHGAGTAQSLHISGLKVFIPPGKNVR